MNCLRIKGKAIRVAARLKALSETHKGMTVAEFLKAKRLEKIIKAEERQFGHKIEY